MKKTQIIRKIFSIVICILLIVTMIPLLAAAQESNCMADIGNAVCTPVADNTTIENVNEAYLTSAESTVAITGTVDYDASAQGLMLLNQIRAENGVADVQLSDSLTRVANLRAAECAVYYSHTRPNNSNCFSAYNNYGINYNYAGENIALGQSSISAVTTAWKNSSGHFANMVNSRYTMVGIGCFTSQDGTKTWVQVFSGGYSGPILSQTGKNTESFSFGITNDKISVYSNKTSYELKEGDNESFTLYAENKGTSFYSKSRVDVSYNISSNESVATYSNGKIYAHGNGTAVLSLGVDSSHYVNVNVTVTDYVSVTGLTLSYVNLPIPKGETREIEAKITPEDSTSQFVTWSSSDPSVARVSSYTTKIGTITAVSPGQTTITGTVGGKSASCNVVVTENSIATVDVTGVVINHTALQQRIGDVTQIAGSVIPSNATKKTITWTSDNPSVAALSTSPSGANQTTGSLTTNLSTGAVYICAKASGTAVITAKAGSFSKTCTVKVSDAYDKDDDNDDNDDGDDEQKEIEVTKVVLSSGNTTLYEGDSKTVTVSVFPSNAVNRSVTWSNNNANVVSITQYSNKSITIKAKKAGTAKITAFAGNCKAYFTVTVKELQSDLALPFNDVNVSDWYYEYVNYAYKNNMMNGVGNYKFAPNATISRAMIVQILYNLQNGKTTKGSGKCVFSDVSSNSWYCDAVKWAASNNIVNGYENGTFAPDTYVTREQLATILYRYASLKKYDITEFNNLISYKDSYKINNYALISVKWAVGNGIISGKTSDTIVPSGKATRAEASAMIKRFCEKFS